MHASFLKSSLLAASIAGLFAANVSGAVLAVYNFTGNADSVSSVPANVGATSLSIGASGTEFGVSGTGHGWSTTATTNNPGAAATQPTRFVRTLGLNSTEAGAVTDSDFFRFTLTPASGFQVNYTDLSFDLAVTTNSLNANTASWFLRSSADGFAANIGLTASVTQGASAGLTSPYTHFSLDLTGLQNLSDPVTFRLYTYSSAAGLTGTINRIDNITLSGDITPIPEPTMLSSIVVAAGLLTLFCLCRRRAAFVS